MASGKKKKKKSRHGDAGRRDDLPAVLVPKIDAPAVTIRGRRFDLDDRNLPDWVEKAALGSGGYPYGERLAEDAYDAQLKPLQIELVKLQKWAGETGCRIVILFEGRDAAGKGSTIFAVAQYLNPRGARIVALPKPDETERGQWYFQRYAVRLPAAGEIVMFDRSWYNRAGVEPVMGFCTPEQHRLFIAQAPEFEKLLVDQGLALIKIWLEIGREMQLMQFHQRRHDPLKIWKLSPIDYAALTKWDAYTKARDEMLTATHRPATPWTIVRANDKRRARLNIIRSILGGFDYAGKDRKAIGATDSKIIGAGRDFL